MKSIRRALTAVALLVVPQVAAAGPIYLGHEYELVLQPHISFADARTAAMALPGGGWDLVSIGDAAENSFVENLVNTGWPFFVEFSGSHFWIGATDTASEGTWVWLDGTPWVFTDWFPSEPDNGTANADAGGLGPPEEDFLAYHRRSGVLAWNDGSDFTVTNMGWSRGFVAERVVAAVPEPATLSLLGLGALVAIARRRRVTR